MNVPALLPSLPALLLQAVLPLALLAALALRTPASVAGFWAHVAATALLLLATSFAGQWTVLPWWTPFVLAAILLAVGAGLYGARAGLPTRRQATRPPLAIAPDSSMPSSLDLTANVEVPRGGARGGSASATWPAGPGARAHLAACALLALMSLAACAEAVRTRISGTGDQAAIDLQFPLPAGDYLVLEGGASWLLNAHRRAQEGAAGGLANTASDGLDLVRLDAAGLRASAPWPKDPTAYFIHGVKVLAPCDGSVQAVRDDLKESYVPAGDTRQPLGNQVVLRCGDAIVTFGHLRAGSARVRAGEQVGVATELAEVGNSGSSPEPTLHVHAERSGAPLRLRFDGRALMRNDRVSVAPPPAPR